MAFFLTPNHVQLIAACYPPSAALLAAGPEYRPNSQELSRLTYYASNRPGKITKLSGHLQKRVVADSRKAQSGNSRARASLLITLSIFKALTTECRRDILLLSAALMSSLDMTLAALPSDLEVTARVASVFATWTAFTDGHLVGVDASFTRDYVATMRRFASMCLVEAKSDDCEERNRTRLIGLAALTGAVTSDALYNSSTEFKPQVSTIIPALLLTLRQATITILDDENEDIKNNPLLSSPYLSEFRTRPVLERRAASIHVHVDGDKGPSLGDVANAALRALSSLLNLSNGTQVGHILQAALNSLEKDGWDDVAHCCWFAEKAVEWTQYQYRYAVPTRLVERLLEVQDDPVLLMSCKALTAMIKTVFLSPTPLVNLSTSDIMSNFITLILRRVAIEPHDTLLPILVDCVAALGTHIYYADQIHDLACELISRLVGIEAHGVFSRSDDAREKEVARSEAIRCLLAGLVGLIRPSDKSSQPGNTASNTQDDSRKDPQFDLDLTPGTFSDNGSPTEGDQPADVQMTQPLISRRTQISPNVWQDTLTLLCDVDFAVRADYTQSLLLFLRNELPRETFPIESQPVDGFGIKRVHPPADNYLHQVQNITSVINGDNPTIRFLNALHASVFVLATSPVLGLVSSSTPSPTQSLMVGQGQSQVNVNVIPSTPSSEVPGNAPEESPQQSPAPLRRSINIPLQIRKLSVAQRLLDQSTHHLSQSRSNFLSPSISISASASDFANILQILTVVNEQLPCAALLTGVPMLLTLENSIQVDIPRDDAKARHRHRCIREVVANVWNVIGRVWECSALVDLIENALPMESNLPSISPTSSAYAVLPVAQEPVPLVYSDMTQDDTTPPVVDSEAALMALTSNRHLQRATGLDRQALFRRLCANWSTEIALKNSIKQSSKHDLWPGDGINPVLKISPALMYIENLSLQSLARSARGVGVSDLRDALEGRSGVSNPALATKPPSVSSFDHSVASGDSRTNGSLGITRARTKKRPLEGGNPTEVRDVLNKLGIGTQNNGNSLLKSSFPALHKIETKSSMLVPPYKN